MKQHPFAMLMGNVYGRSVATQLPLMIEEREGKLYLLGHVTRKQDHHLVFEKNTEALVIFTGAHAYVSATWYENPQNVSTWNYSSVHARGQLRFLDEKDWLMRCGNCRCITNITICILQQYLIIYLKNTLHV